MPEAILNGPSAFIDQRDHFPEDALGILWMETYSPEVFVFEHLPRGKSHDAGHVLADEGACIVARQIGVDDGRRDRHQVTQPFAGGFQFGSAILDPLLQLIVRLAEFFLLALTRTEIGGEADHSGFLAILVEEDRCRNEHGNVVPVLGLKRALIAGRSSTALAHLDQDVSRALLTIVEVNGGAADDIFGTIAEQALGAFVEQDDVPLFVSGNDGIWRALDEPREVTLGLLDLGVGGKSKLFCLLSLGDISPCAHELERATSIVIDDLEGILNPNVVAIAVAEAILDRSAAPADKGKHFAEGSRGIVGMKMVGPTLRVGGHLLRRIAHDRAEILADESAGIIARCLGGVDDGGTYREKVLQALTRPLELCGDSLALGLERFEISDPLAQSRKLVDELLLGLLVVVNGGGRLRHANDFRLCPASTLSSVHTPTSDGGGLPARSPL